MRRSARRTTALIVAALATLSLTAGCGAPRASVGDVVKSRGSSFDGAVTVPVPVGSLRVLIGTPVTSLSRDDTAALKPERAPDGGSFVPVTLDFSADQLPPSPVDGGPDAPVISLRTASGTYPVGTPGSYVGEGTGSATRLILPYRYYVAVPDADPKAEVEVTFDGLTQTVSADGTLDAGAAAPLSDPPTTTATPCRSEAWRGSRRLHSMICSVRAALYPYDARLGWAPQGSTWLVVSTGVDGPILTRTRGTGYETALATLTSRARDTASGARVAKVLRSTTTGDPTGGRQTDVFRVPTTYAGGTLTLTRAFRDREGGVITLRQTLRVSVG